MPAWFDVKDMPCDEPDRFNMSHVEESLSEIKDLILREADSIYNGDTQKIFVSGFS